MEAEYQTTSRLGWRERRTRRRQARYDEYDAFLSYSRADVALASNLQTGLERIAKPWYRARSLRVFRDMSSLSPEAGLWSSIERGLEKSAWFVLLMSPESAGSRWVNREVEWWLEHRPIDRLLLVLTDGAATWDDMAGTFDRSRSPSVPPPLFGQFPEEPSWVDATWSRAEEPRENRLQEAVVDLASTIKQVPKDELFAAAVREHRKTMRLARTGIISLVVLLALVATAGVLAIVQRNNARTQATLATSRQLAAVSESQSASNLDVALVLAADAVRRDDNLQSRSALMRAALSSPHLIRFVELGKEVTAIAGSGDGQVVVGGLSDGRVMRWSASDSKPQQIIELPKQVRHVAIDADGRTVAASDGDGFGLSGAASAELWRPGAAAQRLAVPEGQLPGSIAVSPSGQTVLLHGAAAVSEGAESVSRFEGTTGEAAGVFSLDDYQGGTAPHLVLPSDEEAVLVDDGYGSWDHRRLDDWRSTGSSGVQLGTHERAGEPASGGEFITASNGLSTIPVWRTAGLGRPEPPRFTAEAPISGFTDLALSADGRRLAVADSGTIFVTDVVPAEEDHPEAVRLPGNGNVDHVRFLGDGTHLVSASGSRVAIWDTERLDRLARPMRVAVGPACTACAGAEIRVSPDGKRAAINGASGDAVILDLRTGTSESLPDADFEFSYGYPVWNRSGSAAAIPVNALAANTSATPPVGLPSFVRSWRIGKGVDSIMASARSRDGTSVVAVDERGLISIQSIEDGTVRRSIPGPTEISLGSDRLVAAAVAEGESVVATLLDDKVSVIDASTGRTLARFSSRGANSLAFGGDRLFVQNDDGRLDVRSRFGRTLERTIPGDRSYGWPPEPNPTGTLVARQRSNREIVLVDVPTGQTLVTIPPNPGSVGRKVGVAFSPDGEHLFTVTDETEYRSGAVLVDRDLSRSTLLRSVCSTASQTLTDAEWQLFAGLSAPSQPACR